GYTPRLSMGHPTPSKNQTADDRAREIIRRRAQAITALNHAARDAPADQYQINDKVWLEAKNLALPYATAKLAPKRQGPFVILKRVSPVAYQLQLPPAWTIHDVFHASVLVPYRETTAHGPNFTRPPPDLIGGEAEYEVEAIVGHRFFGRWDQLQYLVKWKGYPMADNTWEPVDQIHADEAVKAYRRRNPLVDKRKKKLPPDSPSSSLLRTCLQRDAPSRRSPSSCQNRTSQATSPHPRFPHSSMPSRSLDIRSFLVPP